MSNKAMRIARVAKGLTLAHLAQRLGVTEPFLSRIEAGLRVPPPRLGRALEATLGLREGDLFPVKRKREVRHVVRTDDRRVQTAERR